MFGSFLEVGCLNRPMRQLSCNLRPFGQMPNGGSQKRRPEPLPSPPPVKRRPLRSNAEEPSPVVMVEPPAEVKGKYFTKDFGAYGIFIGTCIGVRLGAHKHTGKDLFCVQYSAPGAGGFSARAPGRGCNQPVCLDAQTTAMPRKCRSRH